MTDFLGELLNEKVGSDVIGDLAGRLGDLEWRKVKEGDKDRKKRQVLW